MMAVKIIAPLGVELGVTAGEFAQREQRCAGDSGELEFVGFADIDELEPGLEAVEGAFEFLDGDLAGVGLRRRRGGSGRGGRWAGRRGKAAKGLVVERAG